MEDIPNHSSTSFEAVRALIPSAIRLGMCECLDNSYVSLVAHNAHHGSKRVRYCRERNLVWLSCR